MSKAEGLVDIGIANIKDDIDVSKDEYKYIGRANPSKGLTQSVLHNPYTVDEYGRKEAVLKYVDYFYDKIRSSTEHSEFYRELRDCYGKTLVCWCAPKLCHGNVIKLHYTQDFISTKEEGESNLDVIEDRVRRTIEMLDADNTD
jgi:hypothetical protein